MEHALERKPKGQVEFTVTLTSEEFQTHLDAALASLGKTVNLKGFRPGKAPTAAVRQHVGEKALLEEAAEHAVQATYPTVVEREQIKTVGAPAITVLQIAEGNPFRYRATAALVPTVTLPDLTKLNVQRQPVAITDEEVTKAIEEIRKLRHTERLSLEPARHGDKVELDLDIFRDGVPLAGAASKNHPVVIGEGQLIPGFEDHLLGLRPNDLKEFTLTFPQDYHQKNLAGQPAEFRIKVNAVHHLDLPALDDAFAQSVGAFASVAELRDKLRANLLADRRTEAERHLERALLEAVIGRTTFGDIPELLIDEETMKMVDELEHDVTHRGFKFEDYLANLKKTRDDLRREMRPNAERRLKSALIIRTVAEQENLQADRAEIERERAALREEYAENPEALQRIEKKDVTRYLATLVVNRQALTRLKALAGVAELTPDQ